MCSYLLDDLRIEPEEIQGLDIDLLKEIAAVSRKSTAINQLIKMIEHERGL